MARLLYGATSGDYTMTAGGRVIPNAPVEIWDAIEGGTQITDLTDYDGNPCTVVTSGADGLVRFYGPDGENDNLWMDSRQGSRLLVRPTVLTATIGDGSILDEDIAADADIDRSKIAGTALTADSMGVFNVKDYGAVGDGTTDDTDAINAAVTAAEAATGTVLFPLVSGNGYKTTAEISVPGTIDVLMRSPIYYAGAGGEPALTINAASAVQARRRTYELWVYRATRSDWTDESDVGICLRRIWVCTVRVVAAERFTIGVQFLSDTSDGISYNTVTLGRIYDNKVGVDLVGGADVSGADGWVNENLFLNGNISCATSTYAVAPDNLDRWGIRIRSTGSPGYINNANLFVKPSIEIGSPTLDSASEALPVLITHGKYNKFLDLRDERNSATMIRTTGSSVDNYVSTSFDTTALGGSLVDDQSTQPSTMFDSGVQKRLDATRVLFSAPDLAQRAVPYDSTKINVPGMTIGGNVATQYNALPGTISADSLDFANTYHIGVFVNTVNIKRFVLARDVVPTYPGRVFIRCYDSSGTVLDPASYTATPMIRGLSFASTASYGKGYLTGSATEQPVSFVVSHDDVAYIYVSCVSLTASLLKIKAFRLMTPDQGMAAVWNGFPECATRPIAKEAPASGTHTLGKIVWNGEPASAEAVGWICTAAGTPGTWKAFGTIA